MLLLLLPAHTVEDWQLLVGGPAADFHIAAAAAAHLECCQSCIGSPICPHDCTQQGRPTRRTRLRTRQGIAQHSTAQHGQGSNEISYCVNMTHAVGRGSCCCMLDRNGDEKQSWHHLQRFKVATGSLLPYEQIKLQYTAT